MTVLILADEFDPSANQMVLRLQGRGVPACRIDTAWFPSRLSVDAQFRDSRWAGPLRTPRHVVELEEIRSVWYRSPTAFRFPAALSGAERIHAFMEAKFGLGGVLSSLPVLWANTPRGLRRLTSPSSSRRLPVLSASATMVVGMTAADELHETLECWRRVAWMTQSDPAAHRRMPRTAAERLTGEKIPADEPLARIKARLGL